MFRRIFIIVIFFCLIICSNITLNTLNTYASAPIQAVEDDILIKSCTNNLITVYPLANDINTTVDSKFDGFYIDTRGGPQIISEILDYTGSKLRKNSPTSFTLQINPVFFTTYREIDPVGSIYMRISNGLDLSYTKLIININCANYNQLLDKIIVYKDPCNGVAQECYCSPRNLNRIIYPDCSKTKNTIGDLLEGNKIPLGLNGNNTHLTVNYLSYGGCSNFESQDYLRCDYGGYFTVINGGLWSSVNQILLPQVGAKWYSISTHGSQGGSSSCNLPGFMNSTGQYTSNCGRLFNTAPIYRFWSNTLASHFYTSDETELSYLIHNVDKNIWNYEKVGFSSFPDDLLVDDSFPVYRYWSNTLRGHFFTISEDDKNFIAQHYDSNTWNLEKIAFRAYKTDANGACIKSGTVPVYRFWSDTLGHHFFTASEDEKAYLAANVPERVWRYEHVAFCAYPS